MEKRFFKKTRLNRIKVYLFYLYFGTKKMSFFCLYYGTEGVLDKVMTHCFHESCKLCKFAMILNLHSMNCQIYLFLRSLYQYLSTCFTNNLRKIPQVTINISKEITTNFFHHAMKVWWGNNFLFWLRKVHRDNGSHHNNVWRSF